MVVMIPEVKLKKGELKMRNSLSKVQYLLCALLLLALTGCGASNGTTASADLTGNGKVTAKLQWPNGTTSAGKATAKSVASVADVTQVRLVVTGAGIPTAKTVFPVASTSGTVEVYPGSELIVAAYGLDANGTILYEGFATNVTVTSGSTTDVGTIALNPQQVKVADANCVACHDTTKDVTGQNLVANFKQSGHYANQTWAGAPLSFAGAVAGAGCAGCHGPSHNILDPSADGSGANPSATNGTNVRCFDCHNLGNVNTALVSDHGTYYLANGNPCSSCHQVHNTAAANMERRTWAESRHGADDFANIAGGTGSCATRCHNASGFIAAVANPSALVQGTMTPSPQMITCNACHSDAPRGILRTLAGTKAGSFATYTTSSMGYQFAPNQAAFNPNKKAYYPDVAGSNLCIVCHSGTTEGTPTAKGLSDPYFSGSATALTYTSNGTLSPKTVISQHNMPAAAVMYVKFGFTNLSTGSAGVPSQAYLDSITSDLDSPTGKVTSTHRKFGTSAIATDSHFSPSHPAPKNLQSNGPCAVCHVSGSHTFKIDQAAINAVCSNCHTSENGHDISNEAAFKQYFVDAQQEAFNNALFLGAAVINSKVAAYNATPAGIATPLQFGAGNDLASSSQPMKFVFYKSLKDPANPYKTDGTLNVNSMALADYQATAIALGYSVTGNDLGFQKFMGALGNLAFFAKDQGAFAHARTYSRRLIYDSLDFLDDGSLNMSVSTTAKALSLLPNSGVAALFGGVNGLYTKGATAYTNGTLSVLASGSTESMLYLVGWNRTTGAWSTPERP
jgi:hypothetical protein